MTWPSSALPGPAPVPVQPPPLAPASWWHTSRRVGPGRLVVHRLPLLASHRGTHPDLVLRWGAMPSRAPVDVVVHLHGYAAAGRFMRLPRDIEPVSGLDLTNPDDPTVPGRTAPTLLVLPRGHWFGGRTGRGYSFPALVRPGAVQQLVRESLDRFRAVTGVEPEPGRLILTAHSGGGHPLMAVLRHVDPDEVHTFDALYTDPDALIRWARRHQDDPSRAMRVLHRPGEATAPYSRQVAALTRHSPRFRVEGTRVAHMEIPRTYGWRLLADAGADLPGTTGPGRTSRRSAI